VELPDETGAQIISDEEGESMKLTKSPAVPIALRSLNEKDRQKVLSWFDRLKNWENDAYVRKASHKLDENDNGYVLKATREFRIFFRVKTDEIAVVDIASRTAILSMSGNSE